MRLWCNEVMINSQSIEIRPATRADADELFRLAGLLATSSVPERSAFEASLATIRADDRQRVLVADADGGLAGYLYGLTHPAFHANGDVGWIEELYVDEQRRGTGLGRRLMTAFEEWAIESAGAAYFAVATRRAGDFYRSMGYEESASYFKKVSGPLATIERMSESEMTRTEPDDGTTAPSDADTLGATGQPGDNALERDPEEWVSGDDPITPAQRSYLDTLARQAGEELPADLTKAEASAHIDRLRESVK